MDCSRHDGSRTRPDEKSRASRCAGIFYQDYHPGQERLFFNKKWYGISQSGERMGREWKDIEKEKGLSGCFKICKYLFLFGAEVGATLTMYHINITYIV
jgi:hypothetical protein